MKRVMWVRMYILASHMANRCKVKLQFHLCIDVLKKKKKSDSLRMRSLPKRKCSKRGSKSPNGVIEICSWDSFSNSLANVLDYFAIPILLIGSRSQTKLSDARVGRKATLRMSILSRDYPCFI